MTIVREVAWREALEQEAGTETLRHVEAAIESFDLVLDLSTGAQPLVEATVRRLHELATSAQDEYQVLVPLADGLLWQAVPLPKGTYKAHPNHVREADGTFFAYAPVDRVGDEMHRLMGEVRSTSFAEAHPAVQAAYSHHALVRIHPFADGNGRVARLVASVFLLRAVSVPLMVYEDQKAEYLGALRAADGGEVGAFVDFVFDRSLDAMSWVTEALRDPGRLSPRTDVVPMPDVELPDVERRNATALKLLHHLDSIAREVVATVGVWSDEQWSVERGSGALRTDDGRQALGGTNSVIVKVASTSFGWAADRRLVVLTTTKRARFGLGIGVGVGVGGRVLDLRERDVDPEFTTSARQRIEAFVRPCIGELVTAVEEAVRRRFP